MILLSASLLIGLLAVMVAMANPCGVGGHVNGELLLAGDAPFTKKKKGNDGGEDDDEGGGDDVFDESDLDEGGDDELDTDGDDAGGGMGGGGTGPESPIQPGKSDQVELIQKVAAVLAENQGLTIEPSEDVDEFLRHILTASATHKDATDKATQNNGGAGGPGANGEQVNEEPRPMLMSTILAQDATKVSDPEKKALLLSTQALLKDRTAKAKENRLKRIARLERLGVPVAEVKAMKDKAAGYQLSLNSEGRSVVQDLDREIDTWERAAKHFKGAKLMSTLLGTALEQPRPAGADQENDARQVQEMTNILLKSAGFKVPEPKTN